MFKIINGDSLIELDKLEANSIDSIVCDPPYEINFMNKGWDNSGIAYNVDLWKKCLNVLKSGSFMLVFGGSRTFHRVMCAIEDAGFYIKDTMMWLYGSAMPKGENIGLAIDKRNGVESKVVATMDAPSLKDTGRKNKELGNGSMMTFGQISNAKRLQYEIKEAQNEWDGWNTALKPAFEVIIVAQKPIVEKTIVDNVLKWGVGAYNIDECRVETQDDLYRKPCENGSIYSQQEKQYTTGSMNDSCKLGRFPANVILTYDETDYEEVCGGFPESKGASSQNNYSNGHIYRGQSLQESSTKLEGYREWYNDSGSAARYFYNAKATKKDREEGLENLENKVFNRMREDANPNKPTGLNKDKKFAPIIRKNNHPCVKPTELLQYLIKLVTPKGGIVLDPFMGSGSTGKAVAFENNERNAKYSFIGIELSKEYCEIANARINWANNYEGVEHNLEEEKIKKPSKGKLDIFDFI